MAWFRVDDKLHDHPKVRKLRTHKMAALGLWTACGSWSADNLSDGFVPCEIVQRFDPDEGLAKRLVEVSLWEHTEVDGEDGYQFHQWTDHQPTKAEVERRRDDARERMRALRANRKGSQSVRANSERTSPNAFGTTDPHAAYGDDDGDGQFGLYVVSKASPQVDDSVRANNARSSSDVRDPGPSRPEVPYGTKKREGRKRPSTRLPDTWRPTDKHRAFASEKSLDVEHEATKYRNHAEATDRRLADWDAGFRNWMTNTLEYRAKRPYQAVSGGYQPWTNPADHSVYDEPLLPSNPQESR